MTETASEVELCIEISDSGVGIDAAILPTLFQPFRRVGFYILITQL